MTQRDLCPTSLSLAAISNNCKGEIITHLTSNLVLNVVTTWPHCLSGSFVICYNLLYFSQITYKAERRSLASVSGRRLYELKTETLQMDRTEEGLSLQGHAPARVLSVPQFLRCNLFTPAAGISLALDLPLCKLGRALCLRLMLQWSWRQDTATVFIHTSCSLRGAGVGSQHLSTLWHQWLDARVWVNPELVTDREARRYKDHGPGKSLDTTGSDFLNWANWHLLIPHNFMSVSVALHRDLIV